MASALLLLLLLLVGAAVTTTCVAQDANVLLRQAPMVYTHNAGTGYMDAQGENSYVLSGAPSVYNSLSPSRLVDVSQNQLGTFYDQLECGARGLNVRPQVEDGGRLIMHHGYVAINVTVADAMADAFAWLAENPEELVVLGIADCGGSDCWGTLQTVLAGLNVPYYDNCAVLADMTVGDAKREGNLTSGGSVVAFSQSCLNQNYDPENLARCYDTDRRRRSLLLEENAVFDPNARLLATRELQSGGSCRTGAEKPFRILTEHLVQVTSENLTDNVLTHQNAHWQYLDSDIIALVLNGESIVSDTVVSEINEFVRQLVLNGDLVFINLLQVDVVCDGGPSLRRAILGIPEPDTERPTSSPNSASATMPHMIIAAILFVLSME